MIARVFVRRTRATPTDPLAFVGEPPLFIPEGISEVHVSVTFTWDLAEGERLARAWQRIAPVKIGGPAFETRGGPFRPGMYLKEGYVITSRGCPNDCWFCSVPRREGGLRELPIQEGWNVLDDNLLACSENHIRAVFEMLRRQKQEIEFTGGLEANLLDSWHCELLKTIRLGQMFMAFDEERDWEPLVSASFMLRHHGILHDGGRHRVRCYVLIGYKGDTQEAALDRLNRVLSLGIYPMAMLYRDQRGQTDHSWRIFQREWARPSLIGAKLKELNSLVSKH